MGNGRDPSEYQEFDDNFDYPSWWPFLKPMSFGPIYAPSGGCLNVQPPNAFFQPKGGPTSEYITCHDDGNGGPMLRSDFFAGYDCMQGRGFHISYTAYTKPKHC